MAKQRLVPRYLYCVPVFAAALVILLIAGSLRGILW
jgi:hypothetical protein